MITLCPLSLLPFAGEESRGGLPPSGRAAGAVAILGSNQRSAISGRLSCIVNQTGLEEQGHEED